MRRGVVPDQCRSVPALTCVSRSCLLGVRSQGISPRAPFRLGEAGEGKTGRVNASEPLMMPRQPKLRVDGDGDRGDRTWPLAEGASGDRRHRPVV